MSAPAAFFAHMGVTIALGLANLGAAYGTAKSGIGIASMGVLKPDMIMKSIVPIIMAGILGIYGLIVSVILLQKSNLSSILTTLVSHDATFTMAIGYKYLAAGLCCGVSSAGAGFAIGVVGDVGVRMNAIEPKLFVGMILILIFAEAIGLFGLIVSIILSAA